jgi:hypothetical protein
MKLAVADDDAGGVVKGGGKMSVGGMAVEPKEKW